ncbi:MAG: hypothetical protein HEP71_33615 [Roseivirga sp.]|nr:hypothetical protein [Roseivirga sp.]
MADIDPLKALEYGDMARKEAVSLAYPEGEVIALKTIGNIHATQTRIDTARLIIQKGFEKARSFGIKNEMANLGRVLGGLYIRSYQYEQALEVLIESLEMAKSIGAKDSEMAILMNMSVARRNIVDIAGAESNLQDALAIGLEEGFELNTAKVYSNLGYVEFDRANYALAKQYQKQALRMFEEQGVTQIIAICVIQLGRIENELKNFREAMVHFDHALEIRRPSGNNRGVLSIYRYQVQSLLNLREFEQCKLLAEKALSQALEIKDYAILMDLYEALFKLDESAGHGVQALDYYKLFIQSRDSLNARTNRIKAEQLSSQFDRVSLQNEIERQAKSTEIARLKVNQRNLLLAALALLLVFISVFFWLNRLRLKQKLKASQKQQQLMASELELKALEINAQEQRILAFQEEQDMKAEEKFTLAQLAQFVQVSPLQSNHWLEFRMAFDKMFSDFFVQLEPYQLTTNEQRLASLIKLGLANKEVASILAITPKSVNKAKSRLAGKLQKSSVVEFENFLQNLS